MRCVDLQNGSTVEVMDDQPLGQLALLEDQGVSAHIVAGFKLAIDQARAFYGVKGRVVVEAELLQQLVDALDQADDDWLDPEEYEHKDEVERLVDNEKGKTEAAEEQATKFKNLLLDLVEKTMALQKSAKLFAPVDHTDLDEVLGEVIDELQADNETKERAAKLKREEKEK